MRVYLKSLLDWPSSSKKISLSRQVGINGQFDSPRVAHLFFKARWEWNEVSYSRTYRLFGSSSSPLLKSHSSLSPLFSRSHLVFFYHQVKEVKEGETAIFLSSTFTLFLMIEMDLTREKYLFLSVGLFLFVIHSQALWSVSVSVSSSSLSIVV